MVENNIQSESQYNQLAKCPTGIQGLDEITEGGLPKGRPTLVCGTAGCGKTLLGVEFLVRGATQYSEPGVLISFEETTEELAQNVSSLGWDLQQLITENKLYIDHFYIDPAEIQETGEYDLEGIFIRLGSTIDRIGARRVVLDTIEVLFAGLSNTNIVRAELRRLFRWLKDKQVTAIITGERGDNSLTRQGLEEYVSDCVIRLDQRTREEISTRRLQIVKYRGSYHGSNEYPFIIDQNGISVEPITSLGLNHTISTDRIPTGIPDLDVMLDGKGYFRGSSILITGMAGTGKSTIAAHFAVETCRREERCLYIAFEEAPQQILRNMRSVGLDLEPYIQNHSLHIQALRPTTYSLEQHLVHIHRWLNLIKPSSVIIDPISNLTSTGSLIQTKSFFSRLIDHLKSQEITAIFTNLIAAGMPLEHTEIGISSLMDSWIEVRAKESNGERNRLLQILKSRGMNHSNQVREFRITSQGLELISVYLGKGDILVGTARAVQEIADQKEQLHQRQKATARRRQIEYQLQDTQAKLAMLKMQLEAENVELNQMLEEEKQHEENIIKDKKILSQWRQNY